ncbi:polyprenyl synthetase family protein [Candidatus Nitrospira allomarina]|jgi:geranylgeranyl diphosphate synthase, type II|uniref:Polyprenyl synthetase family protein n=1 Tax=Candidatus Nitrospira allomarina TaxID=3020900 RepID=A0AA96GB95_9BACT|nr:polyprenyl synthetase family protein [Candidatus Nitrospira allomarina]WNM58613.1 polyprenyl synthetase family protein [Candidatus Nitrospira allomarina]
MSTLAFETGIHTPRLISQMLEEYGEMTRTTLKKYLPSGNPQAHLYDLLSDYPERGGKMMRSSLCLATARAFGSRLEDALFSAVAIELLHNALLIHDDIEDGSEERRGRPTLHKLHGVPLALNAGDTLSLLSLRPLMDSVQRIGPGLAVTLFKETERVAWESAEGQAMELGWCHDNCNSLKDGDYLTMVLKKTCWLAIIHPSRIGALIGTRGRIDLEPFIRFGFFLGAAFQIQDDLLNLIADTRYGKERNGDIWEGKRTLMLIHICQKANAKERKRLAEIMAQSRDQRSPEQVSWVRRLMDRYGAVDYARRIAHGLAGAALNEYTHIYGGLPDSRDKQFIRGLATWVFERT